MTLHKRSGVLNSYVYFFSEFRISESEFQFFDFSTAEFKKNPTGIFGIKNGLEFCFQWGSQKSELKIKIPNLASQESDVTVNAENSNVDEPDIIYDSSNSIDTIA